LRQQHPHQRRRSAPAQVYAIEVVATRNGHSGRSHWYRYQYMTQSPSIRRSGRPGVTARAEKFPTPNEIASRAHDMFVAGGRRVTKIFEYWRQAEQELLALAAQRAPARPAKKR
jgi:hypothetical protein